MNFSTMSDEQIIKEIAINLEKQRLYKELSSESIASRGGHNMQTYSNFINKGTNIRISTLIQILRGLGSLDEFQKTIEFKQPYSPTGKYEIPKKRIFKNKTSSQKNDIKWGDE